MRTKLTIVFALCSMYLLPLCTSSDSANIEKWKEEIVQTEKNFAAMAMEKGVHQAFVHFAADDAILNRNDSLIVGKKDIDMYLGKGNSNVDKYTLEWSPDFVDVSAAGDLGYTYGKYTISYTDSAGVEKKGLGIFQTIWKRQQDGSWRFVWD